MLITSLTLSLGREVGKVSGNLLKCVNEALHPIVEC